MDPKEPAKKTASTPKGKKKKNRPVRKPSFFLYVVAIFLARWFVMLYWRIKIDKKEIRGLKGPVLALSTHASTIDIVPVLCTLWPKRYNVIAAKDLFTWKELKPFITAFGAVPATQEGMDIGMLRTLLNGVKAGRSFLLFPEGKTSLDGKQLYYMKPGIASLVRKLDCPVVMVKTLGAYATKPRYVKGFRRGRMDVKASVLFAAGEGKTMTEGEVLQRIQKAFEYNDNVWQRENHVKFKAKELASNLNYVLYKCPKCGAEYENEAEKDVLHCKRCGNTARLTPYGELVAVDDSVVYDRIDLWVDFERECIRKEIGEEGFRMEHPVVAQARDEENHNYVDVGEGILYMTTEAIGYSGTRDGEEWNAELPLRDMHQLVTKNQEGVDLFIDKKTYRFLFTERKYSAKYGFVVEELFAKRLKEKEEKRASADR